MKYGNEITVEVDCSLEELQNILNANNFEEKNEYDVTDIYMYNKSVSKNDKSSLEILSNCVLLRNIVFKDSILNLVTYKYKEYNDKEEVVKQGKIDCKIEDINQARELFLAINYEDLIKINDHLIVYSNGEDELKLELVNDKHIYIEIEDKCDYIDKNYSIDEMKNVISKYNIPFKDNNYFAKKALDELEEIDK